MRYKRQISLQEESATKKPGRVSPQNGEKICFWQHAAKTRGRKTVAPPLSLNRGKPALFYGEKRPVLEPWRRGYAHRWRSRRRIAEQTQMA